MPFFDILGNLISLCYQKRKKVILFLGARASIESGNEEIDAAISRVIQEHRFDLAQIGDANRYETFYEILNDMPQDLRHLVLSELFEKMEPTEGYVFLAGLVKRGYFDVVITTNFDNLLETSFTEQQLVPGRHYTIYIVGADKETELRHFLLRPTPRTKVLKLYGDLGKGVVLFTPEETLRLPEEIEKSLRKISEETMLFVGYGERDKNVIRILSHEGESVWWASPSELSWENRDCRHVLRFLLNRQSDRNILCGQAAQFDTFFRSLYRCLTEEELPEREIVGSWNYLWDLAKQQSSRYLGYVQSSIGGRKYIPTVYCSRGYAEKEIDNFLASNQTGLILVGDSGVGKTNLLCHLAERLLEDGNVILLYDCAGSLSLDIEAEIRKDLFIRDDVSCLSALEDVSKKAVRENKCFVVLFDAVNEFRYENATRTADLLKNIDNLIGRCRYPRIKFILSCRTSTWNHLDLLGYTELNWRAYYPGGDDRILTLERFTAEEFDQVYPLYRETFSLKSELSALSDRTKERCQDPLLLRMTAEVYQGKEELISKDAPTVTVFKDYYETKVRRPPAPDEMFLEDLAAEMERNKTDVLPILYLQRRDNLSKHVTEDLDCAYQRLKDVGVLVEIPGEEFEGDLVKFTYDRVFEYTSARHFLRPGKLSVKSKSIEEVVREARGYPSLWGMAKMVLLLKKDEQEFLRLARSGEYEVRELVVESLVALYVDDPKKAKSILRRLITYRPEREPVETELAAGEAGLELPLRTALKAARTIGRGASEIFLEAAASRATLQRDIVANELYVLWQQKPELGFTIVREIIGSIRPQLSSKPLQLLDFAARFSFVLFANNCHRPEVIQQLSDIWWDEFEERYKVKDWFGISVTRSVIDTGIRMAARRGIADTAMSTIALGGAISLERFFKEEAETKEIKEIVERLIAYLDPSTDVIQALPDIKTLLSSELLYPNSLAPLILTVHAFEDFERIREVLEQLFEELPGTGRLWLLLTFVLLAPMKEVPADPLVKLVVHLTSRIQQENPDDFHRGPQGIFEEGFDIGFLPLGLTYGKLGLEMEYLSEIIKRSRRSNDLELLQRCVRGLAAIGLHYPEAALGLLDQALTGQIDQPELRELRKTAVQTLATIGVIYNDKVEHFLLKMGMDESFRKDVQVREDASLVKRYVDAIGLYNVSAYGCRFYPRIRKMVQSGYQAVTECKDLAELVSRITQSYIRLVLDSNYRIIEMISRL